MHANEPSRRQNYPQSYPAVVARSHACFVTLTQLTNQPQHIFPYRGCFCFTPSGCIQKLSADVLHFHFTQKTEEESWSRESNQLQLSPELNSASKRRKIPVPSEKGQGRHGSPVSPPPLRFVFPGYALPFSHPSPPTPPPSPSFKACRYPSTHLDRSDRCKVSRKTHFTALE